MPTTVSINSEQTTEVEVSGPDDIARMYIVSGIANSNLTAYTGGGSWETQTRTFEAHVGPSLTTAEFRRAVATASLAGLSASGNPVQLGQWNVQSVDADFDDEAGQVKLEFDLSVTASGTGAYNTTGAVGFQVIILATAASS